MFEMLKTIILDALGIKAAPVGRVAPLDDDWPPETDVFPDGDRCVPVMDFSGHIIGDRDYTGVV